MVITTIHRDFLFLGFALAAIATVPNDSPGGEQGPHPHLVDIYGDTLPAGAISRLGCSHFRHPGLQAFTTLTDSASIVTVGQDGFARWWDMHSGRQSKQMRLPDASLYPSRLAVSPNGRLVAIHSGDTLTVFDTANNSVTFTTRVPNGSARALGFSPDGEIIAVCAGRNLVAVSLNDGVTHDLGSLVATDQANSLMSVHIQFSANSHLLMVAFTEGHDRLIRLIGTKTYRAISTHRCKGTSEAIAPDGQRLAVILPDLAGGSSIEFLEIARDAVALRPSGSTARLTGAYLDIAYSPDGTKLLVTGSNGAVLLDSRTGGRIESTSAWAGTTFSTDGRYLIGVKTNRLQMFDWGKRTEVGGGPGDFWHGAMAVSPDGDLLASQNMTDNSVDLWDLRAGVLRRRIYYEETGASSSTLAFAAGGRELIMVQDDGVMRRWMVRTGAALGSHRLASLDGSSALRLANDGQQVSGIYQAADNPKKCVLVQLDLRTFRKELTTLPPIAQAMRGWAWSDDLSVMLGYGDPGAVAINRYDGRQGRVMSGGSQWCLSEDGRLLAEVSTGRARSEEVMATVFESGSGGRICRLSLGLRRPKFVVLSHQLRALIVVDKREIAVYDCLLGYKRCTYGLDEVGRGPVDDVPVNSVLVSGEAQAIITPMADGSALVWDVPTYGVKGGWERLSSLALRTAWDELGTRDSQKAFDAVWRLVKGADRSIDFIRGHLKRLDELRVEDVDGLVSDLASSKYSVRQRAEALLAQYDTVVARRLTAARAGVSLEARERIERLLSGLATRELPSDVMRAVRAIAVLERVGSPAAVGVLTDVAGGAEDAVQTQAARAALIRAGRRVDAGRR